MKKKKGKLTYTLIGLVIVMLLWTCMIFCTKYDLGSDFIKHCDAFLLQTGFENVDVFNIISHKKSNMKWNLIFGSSPLMTYLADNEDKIGENTDKGVDKIVMAYPGYSSRNLCWSGAGSDMSVSYSIFERSDALLAEFEEENDEAAVIAENNAARGENDKKIQDDKNRKGDNKVNDDNSNSKVKNDYEEVTALSGGKTNRNIIRKLKKSKSRSYLLKNFYIVDSSTSIDNSIFNTGKLLNMDMSLKKSKKPQILIFHTHGASEAFEDSRKNKKKDSIIGVGSYLSKILRENYGYNVIHDTTYHDYPAYTGSYTRGLSTITSIINNSSNSEFIIDLHRDALGSNSSYGPTVQIGDEIVAQIMFVIGTDGGGLEHPNWNNNLKLAIKIQEKANEMYPGLFKPIILRNSRYNQHVTSGACIIEVGATGNTLEECNNSIKYLAKVISEVMK